MKQGLINDDHCHQWCTLSFGQPSRILHADGYVDVSGQMPVFYYHLKDHLGNVRSVITPGTGNQPEIVQAMEYFPFGMSFESSIPNESEQAFLPNKHKYNSNEEQEMPGKWLDYGARFYDAQLGRWHSLDPLAEAFLSFTPYHYVKNNPVKLYDINGMADNDWFERQQEIDAKYNAQHDAMFNSIMTGLAQGKPQTAKNADKKTESQTGQQSTNGKKKNKNEGYSSEKKILADIATALGFSLGSLEEGMKFLLVTDLELRQSFIEQGVSTKEIDRIISRSGTTGGVARIGGRILFWGQAGYNVHNMIMVDRSFENVALNSVDTFFSGIATYGSLKGMAIAGTYYLGKESIIMTMKGLEQGLIKTNTNMMRNYLPGLAPSPVIWNW